VLQSLADLLDQIADRYVHAVEVRERHAARRSDGARIFREPAVQPLCGGAQAGGCGSRGSARGRVGAAPPGL